MLRLERLAPCMSAPRFDPLRVLITPVEELVHAGWYEAKVKIPGETQAETAAQAAAGGASMDRGLGGDRARRGDPADAGERAAVCGSESAARRSVLASHHGSRRRGRRFGRGSPLRL